MMGLTHVIRSDKHTNNISYHYQDHSRGNMLTLGISSDFIFFTSSAADILFHFWANRIVIFRKKISIKIKFENTLSRQSQLIMTLLKLLKQLWLGSLLEKQFWQIRRDKNICSSLPPTSASPSDTVMLFTRPVLTSACSTIPTSAVQIMWLLLTRFHFEFSFT